MRILIPMSGRGSRFIEKGYTFPKPLISINGRPMIELVLSTLPEANEYVFICQKEHEEKYKLSALLNNLTHGRAACVLTDRVTEGAACSALLAKKFLNDDEPLLIANSDQYVRFNRENFDLLVSISHFDFPYGMDGIIFTFNATHPKWSFVRVDEHEITEVAEKNPISNIATCGIYYWTKSRNFVSSAEEMIAANDRVNGEFYIAPTFNYLIRKNKWVAPFYVDEMHGLGTPEDLEAFIRAH
jgi:dTDP-glucose pyrophosphorylase